MQNVSEIQFMLGCYANVALNYLVIMSTFDEVKKQGIEKNFGEKGCAFIQKIAIFQFFACGILMILF